MGNYTSKIFGNYDEIDKTKFQSHNTSGNSDKLQYTPIMTRKSLTSDPRSATLGITRTPIEVDSTPICVTKRNASAIPKYLQIKPYLETDIDSVMGTLTLEQHIPDPRSPNITCQRTPIVVKPIPGDISPVIKADNNLEINVQENSMIELDPRSPAINFDRTPIMKPKSPGNIDKVSHDHVTKSDTKLTNLQMSYCETTTDYNIPEIQALPQIVSCKLLNFEQRLDACDDTVDMNNLKSEFDTDVSSEESDSEEQITVIPNVNALIDNIEPLKIIDQVQQESKNEFVKNNENNSTNIVTKLMSDCEDNKGATGKIRVWIDSISPKCDVESKAEVFKIPEDIIIEFDDEQSVVKSYNKLDNVSEKTDENKMSNDIFVMKKKKTTAQQFNRDIKLINEDAKEYNGTVVIDKQKSRTPLGNRSNNYKPDVINKSPQPLLRNKGITTKSKQQENTPPRTKRGNSKNKSNSTQWDLDRTVVI